jgi:hypothetical protein
MGPHAGIYSNFTLSPSRLTSQRTIMMNYKEKGVKLEGWASAIGWTHTVIWFMSGYC